MTTRLRTIAAATGAVAVLSAGLIVPALAAQDAETSAPEESAPEQTDRAERKGQREAAFAAALAEELGLDEETVAEAIATVREQLREEHREQRLARLEERLAAAVEAGQLTQEQADAILAAAEAGVLPGPGRRGHGGPGHGGPGFGQGPSEPGL